MAQATETARTVARMVSKAVGRDVSDKRVRAWVRDHVAAFDDDGYTSHQYSPAQVKVIVAGMTKAAQSGRSASAANGRKSAKAARPAKRNARRAKPAPTPEAATPEA